MTTPESLPPAPVEGIAIIGMRGRFPGARSIEQLWDNLCGGVEGISHFSDESLGASGVDPAVLALPNFVRAGGVLDDVDLFDAPFFGFSARDAELMDPQQRVFLETAWEALEDAGYDSSTHPGLIGVFAGTEMSNYLFNIYANLDRLGYVDHFQLLVGNDKDHLTTHVSYKMNLRGPSVACQTACSTSLVAVVTACHSLLSYQCDMALAGGVAINLPQRQGYLYQPGGIVSPDGHCRTFDASAQGTVGANGVGIVVLKRLSEALADGDRIQAVIRGAAINNDGSSKVGYTAPSMDGQAQCIAMAQAMAGVDPDTITYIEAHGTATPLGDPIEVAALTQVFAAATTRKQFCALGSVKSNLGHLNAAAGVTGLIKAALAVEHAQLPPTLHFTTPNPEIDFAKTPFYVQSSLRDWTASPRRAGVSSFGIGGTNAHVVLEEAPAPEPSAPSRAHQLLLLSAKSTEALDSAQARLAAHLTARPDQPLPDVAFTLQVGRRAFAQRACVVCADAREAVAVLEGRGRRAALAATAESRDRPITFLFPGQGTQYPGMGRDLYEHERAYREHVDLLCTLFEPHLGLDLRYLIFPAEGDREEAARLLRQTEFTQPALFTTEFALAAQWIKWGVVPSAMMGHSIGEYVAAAIAGVFALEDVVSVVALRGRLMASVAPGAMLAVPLSERDLRDEIGGDVALAAVNAPSMCVLSGPDEAIAQAGRRLAARGVQGRTLHTSHAFHSQMMDPIVPAFVEALGGIQLNAPALPYLSNVTGSWITAEQATDPTYYGSQLRRTVRFGDGVRELSASTDSLWVEVGPGQTLGMLARQNAEHGAGRPARAGGGQVIVASLLAPEQSGSDQRAMLEALGQLWLCGASVDWAGFYDDESRRRVQLPTYPFQRQSYWIGEPETPGATVREVGNWLYTPSWKQSPAAAKPSVPPAASDWLVFLDGTGLGHDLISEVVGRGHRAVAVQAGERFEETELDRFTVRPGERADYEALLGQLRTRRRIPQHVAHLWGVTTTAEPDTRDNFRRRQALGFSSLVAFAQALEKQRINDAMQVGVVTSHVQTVLGDELICAAKATVLGAAKVVSQEYPALRCRAIDCLPDESNERLAARLVAELTTEPYEPVVAYRRGRRWVQTFDQTVLDRPAEVPARLRHHGVYLITGGLGQIGLILAEALVEAVQARVILTGRSAFPQRVAWDDYLAAHDDAVSAKIRRLQAIEAAGGEVLVVRADAASLDEMTAAVNEAVERFGTVHGVIHGAGNTSAEAAFPVNATDDAAAAAHFGPKADGSYVLEEVLKGVDLDFAVLLSSLSSVLGGLGFTAYAAANAFLDAFAARQNQRDSFPWISINWDAWRFADEELGGVASFTDFVLPDDGKDVFLRVLAAAPGQIVVSTTDLAARLRQWVRLESLQASPAAVQASTALPKHARPTLSTTFVAPRSELERDIADIWQALLGVAPIGVDDKFFELGGHSLLAIQLVSRLRETFQVELPVQRLFEAQTIGLLAESIARELEATQRTEPAVDEILSLVESMTEEEVLALLEREPPIRADGEAASSV